MFLGLGAAGVALGMATFSLLGSWPMVGLGVALSGAFGWVLLGTRYVVGQDVLVVRMGPYRKRIALSDVTRVHRHRMQTGPMLGLGSDFIGIEYGENKTVNVSPRDADGFVEAVKHAAGRLGSP